MDSKMNKKELQEKLTLAESRIDELKEVDELTRREFSKVLDNYEDSSIYGHRSKELLVYSWSEIFTELGKLLQVKNQEELRDEISDLYAKIDSLESVISEILNND